MKLLTVLAVLAISLDLAEAQLKKSDVNRMRNGYTVRPPTTLLDTLEVPATKEYEDDEKSSKKSTKNPANSAELLESKP